MLTKILSGGLLLLPGLSAVSLQDPKMSGGWKQVATMQSSGINCPPTYGYYSAPKSTIDKCKQWCEQLGTCNAISWNGNTCWVQTCPDTSAPSFAHGVTGYEGWVRDVDTDFSVVLFSDPQFGFTDDWSPYTTPPPFSKTLKTIYARDNTPKETRPARLKQASREMIQEAQRLVATSNKNFQAYMVNGDLINDDRRNTVIPQFEDVFQTSDPEALGLPLFLGLGNHDIYNDDTAGNILRFYYKFLQNPKMASRIRDLDLTSADTEGGKSFFSDIIKHRGSWSFAADMGKYTFLFLQNSADDSYNGKWIVRNWIDLENDFGSDGSKMNIALTSPKSWLIHQICKAEQRGQSIILMPHSAQALRAVVKQDQELQQIIQNSAVMAIFSGHIHEWVGQQFKIAGKPAIYLGSPQFETYTTVDFKADGSEFTHNHYSFDPNLSPKEFSGSTLVAQGTVTSRDRRATIPNICSSYATYSPGATKCSVDSDCPVDLPVCDNNWFFGSSWCTSKKGLDEQCTYDSTCDSGNCHSTALQCQCEPCNTPGCGGCSGDNVCVETPFFARNKCMKKLTNGEKCRYDNECVTNAICVGNGGGTMDGYCRFTGAPNGYLCGGAGNGHNENELCASGKCCCSQDAGYNGCGSTWMCYGDDYWDDECRGNGSWNGYGTWYSG